MSPTLHSYTNLNITANGMKCKGANCSNTTSCSYNNSAYHQLLRYLRPILYIIIPFRPRETVQLLTNRVVAPSLRETSGVAGLMIHNFPLLETTIKPLSHYNHNQNDYCFH